MNNQTEVRRAKFEAWAVSVGLTLRGGTGSYLKEIQCAWMAWQAALDSVVVELPVIGICAMTNELTGYQRAISDCRNSIHATGIKTK